VEAEPVEAAAEEVAVADAPAAPSDPPAIEAPLVPAGATVTAVAPVESAAPGGEDEDEDEDEAPKSEKKAGRRKINIEFIEDKSRRHITFSKRKAGIMKKAYELSALTGTQVLLLVASETGHVYTYATEKLQPLIQKPEGKNLIQTCLSAPDPMTSMDGQQALPGSRAGGNPQAMDSNYAAAAAAAVAAAGASNAERPSKQRKMAGGQPQGVPAGMYAVPPSMAGLANSYGRGVPMGGMGGLGAVSMGFAAQGARGGLPFGLGGDGRGALPGMPGAAGLPGMPGAAQLQGISPALLQGLMSGQLPSPAMMGMDGAFGGGVKLEALQQTIADAANAASLAQHQ